MIGSGQKLIFQISNFSTTTTKSTDQVKMEEGRPRRLVGEVGGGEGEVEELLVVKGVWTRLRSGRLSNGLFFLGRKVADLVISLFSA